MRDIIYPPIISSCKIAFKALGMTFQISGSEYVPRTGGAVLAINHISYVDYIFGGLATQPAGGRLVRFMAKKEIFDHKIGGPLLRSMNHISVDRENGLESYQAAVDQLRSGEIVGVFPEATISRAMELKAFKTGAVRMAADAGVPVLPLIVWGGQRMITKGHPRDFSRGKPIALRVGKPMYPTGQDAVAETDALRTQMQQMLHQTIREFPLRPEGQWWAPARYGGTAPTLEEAKQIEDAERRERIARRRAKQAKS